MAEKQTAPLAPEKGSDGPQLRSAAEDRQRRLIFRLGYVVAFYIVVRAEAPDTRSTSPS